jgi:hypothetical protein
MHRRARADTERVSDRLLALAFGILSIALEFPLIGQLFFFGDVFDWGWLFLMALLGPGFALVGLTLSARRRDWLAVSVASLGLGGVVVPVLVVWAIVAAFQTG